MEYVYVLQSLKDHALYIGHTNDLRRRVAEHESGKVPSTKSRLPVRLVYYEACNILDDAIKREKQLKTGFGRAYLNRRLSDIKN
jgi:putative endonuclease